MQHLERLGGMAFHRDSVAGQQRTGREGFRRLGDVAQQHAMGQVAYRRAGQAKLQADVCGDGSAVDRVVCSAGDGVGEGEGSRDRSCRSAIRASQALASSAVRSITAAGWAAVAAC